MKYTVGDRVRVGPNVKGEFLYGTVRRVLKTRLHVRIDGESRMIIPVKLSLVAKV